MNNSRKRSARKKHLKIIAKILGLDLEFSRLAYITCFCDDTGKEFVATRSLNFVAGSGGYRATVVSALEDYGVYGERGREGAEIKSPGIPKENPTSCRCARPIRKP